MERHEPAAGYVALERLRLSWFHFDGFIGLARRLDEQAADDFSDPFVAGGSILLPIFGASMAPLLLFTLLFTSVEATYPVAWAMVGDIFGRKHFAKIRGYMSVFYVWGSVTGPVVAGAIWDRWQTYEPLLWGLVVMFFSQGFFTTSWKSRG